MRIKQCSSIEMKQSRWTHMRKKKKHTMATFRICGIDEMSEFTTSFIPGLREITRSGRSLRATDTEEKREAEGRVSRD